VHDAGDAAGDAARHEKGQDGPQRDGDEREPEAESDGGGGLGRDPGLAGVEFALGEFPQAADSPLHVLGFAGEEGEIGFARRGGQGEFEGLFELGFQIVEEFPGRAVERGFFEGGGTFFEARATDKIQVAGGIGIQDGEGGAADGGVSLGIDDGKLAAWSGTRARVLRGRCRVPGGASGVARRGRRTGPWRRKGRRYRRSIA